MGAWMLSCANHARIMSLSKDLQQCCCLFDKSADTSLVPQDFHAKLAGNPFTRPDAEISFSAAELAPETFAQLSHR